MPEDNPKKKIVAVIPARYDSKRLPGKPLIKLGDKTIIEMVHAKVQAAKLIDEVYIATDDERIYEHAKSFGANVEMTSPDHQSGTDRIAELAHKFKDWSVVVNIQGDEPFINPIDIDKAVEAFRCDPMIEMTSLYHETSHKDEVNNPNNVKLVTNLNGEALYFSRSAIPLARDGQDLVYKKHIGLYAYRRDILMALSKLEASPLEMSERLEQLRALENDIKIKMFKVDSAPIGIDTQEDLLKAQELVSKI